MNFYRFPKCPVPFLRPPSWRSRKAVYKGWKALQRGHSNFYSFSPTTVRGMLLITKGEKQETAWQNRFVK